MRWFARRLVFYVFAIWVALTINFLLPRLMPGDPVAGLRFDRPGPEVEVLRADHEIRRFDVEVRPPVGQREPFRPDPPGYDRD